MPAFANTIGVYDGQPTPVLHTFAPESRSGNKCSYVDRATGISIAFPRLEVTHNLASKGNSLNKVRFRVNIPVLETIAGDSESGYTPAPRLAFSSTADIQFIFHERMTEQQRKDCRSIIGNLLLTAGPATMVDDLEAPY